MVEQPKSGGLRIQSGLDESVEVLANRVIGAGIEVHRTLGPGHLESVYENAFCIELTQSGVSFIRQHPVRVSYKGHDVSEGRMDLVIDNAIIIELKAVESLAPIHEAQLIAYLKATGLHLGLLMNFNVPVLKNGLKRVIV